VEGSLIDEVAVALKLRHLLENVPNV